MAWDGRTVDDLGQGAMEWLTCPWVAMVERIGGHGVRNIGGPDPRPRLTSTLLSPKCAPLHLARGAGFLVHGRAGPWVAMVRRIGGSFSASLGHGWPG